MKNKFFIAAFCILSYKSVKAQQSFTSDLSYNFSSPKIETFWDRTSFEISYGYAMPLSPTTNISVSDYNSFINFQLGANYKFNDFLGLRLTYAHHAFENKNNPNLGINMNKFMAEATLSVMNVIYPNSDYSKLNNFDIIAHAGFGGTFAKSKPYDSNEKILNLQFGLKPTYKVDERVNLFLDVTGVANLNQDYGFNGMPIDGKSSTGYFLSTMIGVQVTIGN